MPMAGLAQTAGVSPAAAGESAILERALQLEAEAIAGFIETLLREQGALAEQSLESLVDLAAEKAARLATLGRFAMQRTASLRAAGCGEDAQGLRAWLAVHAGLPGVALEWARLGELAREARAQNEINGRLIASGLQRAERLLAFLHKAASNEPVYAANGLARSSLPQRSLGEA